MNAERLLTLADFLERIPKERWDYQYIMRGKDRYGSLNGTEATHVVGSLMDGIEEMNVRQPINSDCGATGCALGWSPYAFPQELQYIPQGTGFNDSYCIEVASRNRTQSAKDQKLAKDAHCAPTFAMARDFYDLTEVEVDYLFVPADEVEKQLGRPGSDASPHDVALHIRAFVESDGKMLFAEDDSDDGDYETDDD